MLGYISFLITRSSGNIVELVQGKSELKMSRSISEKMEGRDLWDQPWWCMGQVISWLKKVNINDAINLLKKSAGRAVKRARVNFDLHI